MILEITFTESQPPNDLVQLVEVVGKAHQYITFTTPPNLQAAVSYGLGKADDYFEGMRRDMQRSRDRFTSSCPYSPCMMAS